MTVHMLGRVPPLIHVWCVGLNIGEKQSFRNGVLCARSGGIFGESLFFLNSCQKGCMSRRAPGGCQNLKLGIFRDPELEGRCAVVSFPPQTPCVTPVLPGPGSDTRMKIGVENIDKNGRVWGLVFPKSLGVPFHRRNWVNSSVFFNLGG